MGVWLFFRIRNDAKPARCCMSLGKPVHKSEVSHLVKSPGSWTSLSVAVCLFLFPAGIGFMVVFFFFFFLDAPALAQVWWEGEKAVLCFAWHRLFWSINNCLLPQTSLARVPRWEGWQSHGAWGEVLCEAFLVETERNRHKNVWLWKRFWLRCMLALKWKPAWAPSSGPGWKLSC